MVAFSILFVLFVYAIVIVSAIFCVWKATKSNQVSNRIIYSIGAVLCVCLLGLLIFNKKHPCEECDHQWIGTYYLTKYPDCDSCVAILKEDHTFTILSNKKSNLYRVLEKGNWHFVQEYDFLGLYMDKEEQEMLGYNRFTYSYHIDYKGKRIDAPLTGP